MDNETDTTTTTTAEGDPSTNETTTDESVNASQSQEPNADPNQGGSEGDPTGGKADGDKTGDAEGGAPESYSEFTMPEGVEIDTEFGDQITELFKADGLSQDQAQKYMDIGAGMIAKYEQEQATYRDTVLNQWKADAQNDTEFGGENFEQNVAAANEALRVYGDSELAEFLEESGVGNHPAMIRMMYKLGVKLKEDSPGSTSAPSNPAKDRVSQLYPNDRNTAT